MENFQEMLTKLSTTKKSPGFKDHGLEVKPFCPSELEETQQTHTDALILEDGWSYIGQVFDKKFDGFGELFSHGQIVYSGDFFVGKLHGKGTL